MNAHVKPNVAAGATRAIKKGLLELAGTILAMALLMAPIVAAYVWYVTRNDHIHRAYNPAWCKGRTITARVDGAHIIEVCE